MKKILISFALVFAINANAMYVVCCFNNTKKVITDAHIAGSVDAVFYNSKFYNISATGVCSAVNMVEEKVCTN